jgi:hypothetical protein
MEVSKLILNALTAGCWLPKQLPLDFGNAELASYWMVVKHCAHAAKSGLVAIIRDVDVCATLPGWGSQKIPVDIIIRHTDLRCGPETLAMILILS